MRVLLETYPYRYCESDNAGWIEKYNWVTKRYSKMYECDSQMQLLTAMEDFQYTLWLDPEGVPCYRGSRGNSVRGHR